MLHPVVIIGAGPAGIAAAIQLKRSGFQPLVLEKDRVGGLLLNANLVENYPGFPQGISGKRLVTYFKKHVNKLKIRIRKDKVKKVKAVRDGFDIITDKQRLRARAVIVATGTRPRLSGFIGEVELSRQHRIHYEIKDLSVLFRKDILTIVGGGDAAFDYALNLATRVKTVNIIYRGKYPKCLPLLWQRVKKVSRIKLLSETAVLSAHRVRVKGKNCLIVTLKKGKKVRSIKSDWLIVAVGREPIREYLSWPIRQAVRIPGLFIAGDIKRGVFRQMGIAVGDGLLAAMQTIEYLREKTS